MDVVWKLMALVGLSDVVWKLITLIWLSDVVWKLIALIGLSDVVWKLMAPIGLVMSYRVKWWYMKADSPSVGLDPVLAEGPGSCCVSRAQMRTATTAGALVSLWSSVASQRSHSSHGTQSPRWGKCRRKIHFNLNSNGLADNKCDS